MGYTRIRGGWNNGRAYTVYFYAVTDHPFVQTATWKGSQISNERYQPDSQQKPELCCVSLLLQIPFN